MNNSNKSGEENFCLDEQQIKDLLGEELLDSINDTSPHQTPIKYDDQFLSHHTRDPSINQTQTPSPSIHYPISSSSPTPSPQIPSHYTPSLDPRECPNPFTWKSANANIEIQPNYPPQRNKAIYSKFPRSIILHPPQPVFATLIPANLPSAKISFLPLHPLDPHRTSFHLHANSIPSHAYTNNNNTNNNTSTNTNKTPIPSPSLKANPSPLSRPKPSLTPKKDRKPNPFVQSKTKSPVGKSKSLSLHNSAAKGKWEHKPNSKRFENSLTEESKTPKKPLANEFSNLVIDSGGEESSEDSLQGVPLVSKEEMANKQKPSAKKVPRNLLKKEKAISKNDDREDEWPLSDNETMEDILRYYDRLEKEIREKMSRISKREIVCTLIEHFKVNCMCGNCSKKESFIEQKIHEMYDEFYSEITEMNQIDSDDDLGIRTMGDEEKTLFITKFSSAIDGDILSKTSSCFIDKFNTLICANIKEKCLQYGGDNPLEFNNEETEDGNNFSANEENFPENNGNAMETEPSSDEAYDSKFEEMELTLTETEEIDEESFQVVKSRILEILGHFAQVENKDEIQSFAQRLTPLILQIKKCAVEHSRVKKVQETAQKQLEEKQKWEIFEQSQAKKPSNDLSLSNKDHFQHLSLRQKQLEEQQNQLRLHYSEQKRLQRRHYLKIKHEIDTHILQPPLHNLSAEIKLKIVSELKYLTSIDEGFYDTLTSIEYGNLIEACLPSSLNEESEASWESDSENRRFSNTTRMFQCFTLKMFHSRVYKSFVEMLTIRKQQRLLEEEEEEKAKRLMRMRRKKEKRKRYRAKKERQKQLARKKG